MKKKIAIGVTIGLILATMGRIVYADNVNELAKVLEAAADGFKIYLDFLIEVLKIVW